VNLLTLCSHPSNLAVPFLDYLDSCLSLKKVAAVEVQSVIREFSVPSDEDFHQFNDCPVATDKFVCAMAQVDPYEVYSFPPKQLREECLVLAGVFLLLLQFRVSGL